MIPIKPYFDDIIDSLSEDNLSKKRNRTTMNPKGDSWFHLLMTQQHQHKIDRKLYAAKDVKDRLVSIFQDKCAFCECNRVNAPHDIEHFRPKILYYWLCYEWTNLLLSCPDCNRDHKKVQFPLENEANRIKTYSLKINGTFNKADCHIDSTLLQSEKPCLLHPAIDDPRQHLRFLKDGSVEGLTPKGQISIDVYGLNRDRLIALRKGIIREIQETIWSEYKVNPLPSEQRIQREMVKIITKLAKQIDENQAFRAFRTAILEHFELFIIDNEDVLEEPLPNREMMRMAVRAFMA